jgi:hypothetical protein
MPFTRHAMRRLALAAGLFAALPLGAEISPPAEAAGRTIYVNATSGNDSNDCLAADRACRTIQRGANVVRGGDRMIVGPGTYYEAPSFQNLASSSTSPVWILSETPGAARISGMWKEAALGQVSWQDDGGGVYSAPHGPALFGSYNGTFLFRSKTVTDLRNANAGGVNTPSHGFAAENGRIYVRLPNAANPNGKSILFSPPTWGETGALEVVRVSGSPYVILDGFVFEGSGTFCVTFSQSSTFPTVRNSRFEYCRYGVQLPDNSLVEWSEYSYPGFYDFAETVRQANGGAFRIFDLIKNYWPGTMEGGLADTYGSSGTSRNCEFRYNFLHDSFDGESLGDFEYSESHHSVYRHNYDDHIEMENWAGHGSRELRLHDSLFLSAGLISHQETRLVGPQYVYRNVVIPYDSHAAANWTILKTKAANATPGIYFYHNLFWGNSTELFWEEESRAHIHFRNNILVFQRNRNSATATTLDSDYNLLVNDVDKPFLYGSHGSYLGTNPSVLGFLDAAGLNFGILATSPAVNRGVSLPGFNDSAPGGPDIGPFESGVNPGTEWPRPRRTVYTTAPPERWNGGPPPGDTTPPGTVQNLRRADTQ